MQAVVAIVVVVARGADRVLNLIQRASLLICLKLDVQVHITCWTDSINLHCRGHCRLHNAMSHTAAIMLTTAWAHRPEWCNLAEIPSLHHTSELGR